MDDNGHPMRRKDDIAPQPVVVNAVSGMTKKFLDHGIALMFGVFLAFITGFPATLWMGSRWTQRIEGELKILNQTVAAVVTDMTQYKTEQAQASKALSEGVGEIDKTMARVVANQENLQARVDRLERNDDSQHRVQ